MYLGRRLGPVVPQPAAARPEQLDLSVSGRSQHDLQSPGHLQPLLPGQHR